MRSLGVKDQFQSSTWRSKDRPTARLREMGAENAGRREAIVRINSSAGINGPETLLLEGGTWIMLEDMEGLERVPEGIGHPVLGT